MFSNLDPCFEEAVTHPCIPTWFRAKLWENKKRSFSIVIDSNKIPFIMNPNTFNGFLADSNTVSKRLKHNYDGENDGTLVELDQGKTFMTVLFRQV